MSAILGRATTVGRVTVHPYTLGLTLEEIRIAGPAANALPLLTVKRIDAAISPVSVFRIAPVVNHLTIDTPSVRIERLEASRFDLSDILERLEARPASNSAAQFSLNNIELDHGSLAFVDDVTGSTHTIEDLTVHLPFLSNIRHDVDEYTEPVVAGRLDGTDFALNARAKPFASDLETALGLKIDALDVPAYLRYAPVQTTARLASAKLATDLELAFRRDPRDGARIQVSGKLELSGVRLEGPDGRELAALKHLVVNIKDVDPLAMKIDLDAIEVDEPSAQLHRLSDGSIDLIALVTPHAIGKSGLAHSDIGPAPPGTSAASPLAAGPAVSSAAKRLPSSASSSASAAASVPPGQSTALPVPTAVTETTAKPATFRLGRLRIKGGRIDVADASFGPTFAVRLSDIALEADDLSDTHAGTFALGLATGPDEKVAVSGRVGLAPLNFTGHASLVGVRLDRFAALVAAAIPLSLEAGQLSADSDVDLDGSVQPATLQLHHTQLSLKGLRLRKSDERDALVAATELALADGEFDLMAKTYHAKEVHATGLSVALRRDAQGVLNIATLASAAAPVPGPSVPGGSLHSVGHPHAAPAALQHLPESDARRADVVIEAFRLESGTLSYEDVSASAPVHLKLEDIAVHAMNLRTAPGTRMPFEMSATASKGHVQIKGSAVAAPLSVQAEISSQRLPLAPLAGLAARHLNIAIANADLNLKGAVKLVSQPTEDVRFTGALEVTDLVALDKVSSADFLRWKSLKIAHLDAALAGPATAPVVNVGDVTLSDFYSRLIVYPNGRLNLENVRADPNAPAAQSVTSSAAGNEPQAASSTAPTTGPAAPREGPPGAGAEPTPAPNALLRLKSLRLVNGSVNFTDNFVRPNYTTNIVNLTGSVSSVASDVPQPADVALKGSLEGNGDLDVTGKVNPLFKPMFLDIAARASDIELTRLSTYAAKYAGYNIDKGKLSMKVHYHIENNALAAQNNLYLDQLTFGERVDSPTATKLPVLFAVSLLKDSRGVIDVNLPVSGSLSDPQFSMGGIIIRVILNLLEKAVVSPFQLLGSLGGGGAGDELGYIEFGPGETTLSPAAQTKILKVASLLKDRPALKLDIIGRADPQTDPDGARRARLLARVKAQKYRELEGRGEALSVEAVNVTPEEYPRYLEAVYKDMDFDKPKNLIGFAKSLPNADMERLILANMPVSQEDLQSLAFTRASTVRDALEKAGGIDGARIFMVAPQVAAPEAKDKAGPNRVDFALH